VTVVVGYIPDKYGEAALEAGIEEAGRRGTDLVIVNATKGDALVDRRYVGDDGWGALEGRLRDLQTPHQLLRAMGADVADEILRVVRETDAALVVIGIRHRTPVGKMLMGSVAQQVLLDSPCPVLAVKPTATH
jgi:nucleotide-binding universal stress UspA family protein